MKKLLVGLASVTLAVSAWGQSRVSAHVDSTRDMPIQNCLSAFEHREATLVYEANNSRNGVTRVTKIVLLLERQGRLDSGYYQLTHELYSSEFVTVCQFRPLN